MPGIRRSVGYRGANVHSDVLIVQDLLNDHMRPPMKYLKEDGIAGRNTRSAIRHFQRTVVGIRPDGRVDPGHRTIKALLGESAFTGLIVTTPPPLPGAPKGAPPSHGAHHKRAARQAMEAEQASKFFKDFWNLVTKDVTPEVKRFFCLVGKAEQMAKIATFYAVIRSAGLSSDHCRDIFRVIAGLEPKIAAEAVTAISKVGGPIRRSLGKVADAGAKAGYVVMLIEYLEHCRKGDYHMAWVEAYKFGMGKAIPWADFIDGLQSFVKALLPALPRSWAKALGNDRTFKAMQALNPLDLGAQAVDSIIVGELLLIELATTGKLNDARLNRLAKRVKDSSAGFFYDLGDDMADALYKMAEMPEKEFWEMFTIADIVGWLLDIYGIENNLAARQANQKFWFAVKKSR